MSRIIVFGDICPTPDYRHLFDNAGIFSKEILHIMNNADYVIGNLECPATNCDKAIIKAGPNLKALPKDIAMLKSIGFDILSLANNHILDYGSEGVCETLEILAKNEILKFGAGLNIDDAELPLIVERNNEKIGFISFAEEEFNLATEDTPGACHFNPYRSLEQIKRLKSEVNYLIVLYHGGIEYYKYPSPELQMKCRKMIDFGADFVSIQHSHCIGTIEDYKDGVIIYGQGNSVFGIREKSPSWNEGLLIEIDTLQRTVNYRLMQATSQGVGIANSDETEKRLLSIKDESRNLNNPEWIKSSWGRFCQSRRAMVLPQLYGRSVWFNRMNRVLNNRLFRWLYTKKSMMTTMNLIRCEAHNEVLRTILKDELK